MGIKNRINYYFGKYFPRLFKILSRGFACKNFLPFPDFCLKAPAGIFREYTGEHAHVKTEFTPYGSGNNSLFIKYRITSRDYSKNWIKVERLPFQFPVAFNQYDGIRCIIENYEGKAEFRFHIYDKYAGEIFYNDYHILLKPGIHHLYMPFSKFKRSDGSKLKGNQCLSGVTGYGISIGTGYNSLPVEGSFRILDISFASFYLLNRYMCLPEDVLTRNFIRYDISNFSDIPVSGIENFYFLSAGKDAAVKFELTQENPVTKSPALRLTYGIYSTLPSANWIALIHNDFHPYLDFTFMSALTFFIKPEGKGGKFIFFIKDKDNNEVKVSDITSLYAKNWTRISVSKEELIAGNLDITKIKSFGINIGLGIEKPDIEQSLLITPPMVFINRRLLANISIFPFEEYTLSDNFSNQINAKVEKILKEDEIRRLNLYLMLLKAGSNKFYPFLSEQDSATSLTIQTDKLLNGQKEPEKVRHIKIDGQLYPETELKIKDKKIKPIFAIRRIEPVTYRLDTLWGLDRAAVFVEVTNLCNLKCIMCNHGDHNFHRPLGVMKLKEYVKILEEVDTISANIWEFSPYWLGESFIHPQINEILSLTSTIKNKGGKFVHFNIHTNGVQLTDSNLVAIVNSSLNSILFSIDAATAETYSKIRIGGDFEKVIQNIKKLRQMRDSKRTDKKPAIIAQFILMDENAHELKKFIDMFRNFGFKNFVYSANPAENPYKDIDVQDTLFPNVDEDTVFIKALEPNAFTKKQKHREITSRKKHKGGRTACASLFKMLSIAVNGEATACCRDDQVSMSIGNVFKDGLSGVWFSEKLKEMRLAHIKGEFDKVPKCKSCVNWLKYELTSQEIEFYLKSIGQPELIKFYFNRIKGS